MNPTLRKVILWLATALWISTSGCSTAYYGAMEKAGFDKRQIMVHRVEKARDSQRDAKEQFKSALERFAALTHFKGDDLQDKYNQLQHEFDASQAKADEVHRRIADIEDVSAALFDEWQAELNQYSSASLKRSSEQKLGATRSRYELMIAAMKKAESRIAPILATLHDQVLYLKHNLNAKAIASLRDEVVAVETNVSVLVKEMDASIKEADGFILNMDTAN